MQPGFLKNWSKAAGRPAYRRLPKWLTFKKNYLPTGFLASELLFVSILISSAIFMAIDFSPTRNLQLRSVSSVSQFIIKHQKKVDELKTGLPKSNPVSLKIPSIGLNTSLITTDRQKDGSIAMPDRFDVAAWYTSSPTPGQIGPAIIVGHVDSYKGIAVFWKLRYLKPGDVVVVGRADGKVARFVVSAVKQFPKDKFPSQQVYGKISYAGIRLITCSGDFNTRLGEYTDNTVVYGKLV